MKNKFRIWDKIKTETGLWIIYIWHVNAIRISDWQFEYGLDCYNTWILEDKIQKPTDNEIWNLYLI